MLHPYHHLSGCKYTTSFPISQTFLPNFGAHAEGIGSQLFLVCHTVRCCALDVTNRYPMVMTVCFVRPSNKSTVANRDGALEVGPCFRESDLTKGQTLCEQISQYAKTART